ncbi:MAG: roadblock/LC7 domain-containing protein [Bacteroidetes bacterium]|nr:roadblock/LC7 domain-containing protein [Bacteroidota bacterium]
MLQTKKLKDGSKQIILNGKQFEGVTKVLSELASKTKASAILFADMSGQLISQRGNTDKMNTTVLSALAASDFAATAEMAKLVGEDAKFKLLFHEGEKRNVYLSNVGDNFFLVVVFDTSVTLGLIRIYTKKAIQNLLEIFEDTSSQTDDSAKDLIDSEFGSLLGDALDESFK